MRMCVCVRVCVQCACAHVCAVDNSFIMYLFIVYMYMYRSYLSKRDLDAHMAYRHNTVLANQQPAAPMVQAPPAFYPFPPGLPPPPLPPAPGIPPMQPQRMPPPHSDNVHLMR